MVNNLFNFYVKKRVLIYVYGIISFKNSLASSMTKFTRNDNL